MRLYGYGVGTLFKHKITSILFAIVFGALSTGGLPAGDFPTYCVTETHYENHPIEVANYHGYRIIESKQFKVTNITKYYIINDKIAQIERSYTDDYLIIRYKNHP